MGRAKPCIYFDTATAYFSCFRLKKIGICNCFGIILLVTLFFQQSLNLMTTSASTQPTPFQILAAVIRGNAKSNLKSSTVPFSARMPEYLLAKLDAMGTMAGKSRNAMLIHLMDSCFEQLQATLDAETAQRFEELTHENINKLTAKKSDRESFEG